VWKQVAAALLLLTGTTGNFYANAQSITDGPVKLDVRVYTLRGDMGIFFSTGMDQFAAELNQLGLTAGVYNWLDWIALADDAIARYRAALRSHAHSLGRSLTWRRWTDCDGLAVVLGGGSGRASDGL
jgi:hypothetical protein